MSCDFCVTNGPYQMTGTGVSTMLSPLVQHRNSDLAATVSMSHIFSNGDPKLLIHQEQGAL